VKQRISKKAEETAGEYFVSKQQQHQRLHGKIGSDRMKGRLWKRLSFGHIGAATARYQAAAK